MHRYVRMYSDPTDRLYSSSSCCFTSSHHPSQTNDIFSDFTCKLTFRFRFGCPSLARRARHKDSIIHATALPRNVVTEPLENARACNSIYAVRSTLSHFIWTMLSSSSNSYALVCMNTGWTDRSGLEALDCSAELDRQILRPNPMILPDKAM